MFKIGLTPTQPQNGKHTLPKVDKGTRESTQISASFEQAKVTASTGEIFSIKLPKLKYEILENTRKKIDYQLVDDEKSQSIDITFQTDLKCSGKLNEIARNQKDPAKQANAMAEYLANQDLISYKDEMASKDLKMTKFKVTSFNADSITYSYTLEGNALEGGVPIKIEFNSKLILGGKEHKTYAIADIRAISFGVPMYEGKGGTITNKAPADNSIPVFFKMAPNNLFTSKQKESALTSFREAK